jgi:hypothetical protein
VDFAQRQRSVSFGRTLGLVKREHSDSGCFSGTLSKALARLRLLSCTRVYFVAGDIDGYEHDNNKELSQLVWLARPVFASPLNFQRLLSADLDGAPYGAVPCSVHTSLLA